MKTVDETLEERGKQHGEFKNHAEIEAKFRHIVNTSLVKTNAHLTNVQEIGLGMILHKIARILNGGNYHIDSWHDIAGYATLVEREMKKQEPPSETLNTNG